MQDSFVHVHYYNFLPCKELTKMKYSRVFQLHTCNTCNASSKLNQELNNWLAILCNTWLKIHFLAFYLCKVMRICQGYKKLINNAIIYVTLDNDVSNWWIIDIWKIIPN